MSNWCGQNAPFRLPKPEEKPGQSASSINQSPAVAVKTPQQSVTPVDEGRRSWNYDQGNPAYGVSQLERHRYRG